MNRSAVLLAAAAVLSACAASPAPEPAGFASAGNTNSPIAGQTLTCSGDYPDSRLVFAPDGTIGGRYAGHEVSGNWNAAEPDRVEVFVQAGAIAVRDTVRRAGAGWRGENTSCG